MGIDKLVSGVTTATLAGLFLDKVSKGNDYKSSKLKEIFNLEYSVD